MIHEAEDVRLVRAWFSDCLEPILDETVRDHLLRMADRLHQGLVSEEAAAWVIVKNWHPDLAGGDTDTFRAKKWSLPDAQFLIAREHGFNDFAAIIPSLRYDPDFKVAVYCMLSNDLEGITAQLDRRPRLTQQRSVYGHRATLLHYAAANGTETRAQRIPAGLVKMVQTLIAKGADPSAKMNVYGGHFTVMQLLTSGGHPYAAGIGEEIEALL